ncbi:hypothetical protein F5Y15DRAFT_300122 [Xylariaceae sp. FL0016]|nr:hypothetical protein F5Y15DRAFT_300122 [Xylariaceae sp. FL0016]
MSSAFQPQSQAEAPEPTVYPPREPTTDGNRPDISSNIVTPAKRSEDDIQFISSNPVKKRKISDHTSGIAAPQSTINPPAMVPHATPYPNSPDVCHKDVERRLSTGMVELPSDLHAVELAYSLRGVSLPILEKFTFDQPVRKSRPLSPPELSPKQRPSAISPTMLNSQTHDRRMERLTCLSVANNHTSITGGDSDTPQKVPPLGVPNQSQRSSNVCDMGLADHIDLRITRPSEFPQVNGDRGTHYPRPPLPMAALPSTPNSERMSPPVPANHHPGSGPLDSSKHPCEVCAKMRQQAQLAGSQGIPMINPGIPHQLLSQMSCHPPFAQHRHHQMMAMAANNLHTYGSSGFAPVMMPMNGHGFAPLPSHISSPMQQGILQQRASRQTPVQQSPGSAPSLAVKAADQQKAVSAPPSKSSPKPVTAASTTTAPAKPPISLTQPTRRKPSPNLVVDIAETCQERFPFEEVAKRHNVTVDKVLEVFGAIIQVPLLRCPTDRRRAGKLGTTRVKEYNKMKKEIQDSRSKKSPRGSRTEYSVTPAEVAQRLGITNFPEGFTLRD